MRSEMKLLAAMDRATRKPVIAFKVIPETFEESVMLRTHGFGETPEEYTFFYDINRHECDYNPYRLSDTLTVERACVHVQQHWDEIKSGSLVDAQYLRGETDAPRRWESEYL